MRTLKLIARFYRGFFLPNILVTISCVYIQHETAAAKFGVTGVLFWYKLITMALILWYILSDKKKELYYYQNLGISKVMLAVTTSVFDFSLCVLIYLLSYKTV